MPEQLKKEVVGKMRQSYAVWQDHPEFEKALNEFFEFLFLGFLEVWQQHFPDQPREKLKLEILEQGKEGRHFYSRSGCFNSFLQNF